MLEVEQNLNVEEFTERIGPQVLLPMDAKEIDYFKDLSQTDQQISRWAEYICIHTTEEQARSQFGGFPYDFIDHE